MKHGLRIKGLVRFANQLREALSASADPAYWRTETDRALATVNQALRKHGLNASDLPAPSQRAYRYLRNVNFDRAAAPQAPKTSARPAAQAASAAKLRFPGIQRQLDDFVNELAACPGANVEEIAARIADVSRRLELAINKKDASAQQLSDKTRAARGWFAYFAIPQNLQCYTRALQTASSSFTDIAQSAGIKTSGVTLQFRPMGGLYRLYTRGRHYELRMPTAMITLDSDCFRELTQHVLGISRQRQRLMTTLSEQPYQSLQAQIESLAGLVENHRGRVHDLNTSFQRVNLSHFGAGMQRPSLCWSARMTHRKLGHYDPIRDTVMISSTLDAEEVPQAALDFVMYHELLHKQHGIRWQGERSHAHTPAFRRDEQRYPGKAEIEALLSELCARRRRFSR